MTTSTKDWPGVVKAEDGSTTVYTAHGRAQLVAVSQTTAHATVRGVFIGLVRYWPRTGMFETWYPVGAWARGAPKLERVSTLEQAVGQLLAWAINPASELLEYQTGMFGAAR